MANLKHFFWSAIRIVILAFLVSLITLTLIKGCAESKDSITILALNNEENLFTDHLNGTIALKTIVADSETSKNNTEPTDVIYFNNSYNFEQNSKDYTILDSKTKFSPLVVYINSVLYHKVNGLYNGLYEEIYSSKYDEVMRVVKVDAIIDSLIKDLSWNDLVEESSDYKVKLNYRDISISSEGPAFLTLLANYFSGGTEFNLLSEEEQKSVLEKVNNFLAENPSAEEKNLFESGINTLVLSYYVGEKSGYEVLYLTPTVLAEQTFSAITEKGAKYLNDISDQFTHTPDYSMLNVIEVGDSTFLKTFIKDSSIENTVSTSKYDCTDFVLGIVVIAIVEIVAILVYIYNNYWNCRIPNMLVALESAFISLLTLLLLIFPNIIISVLVTVTAIIISGCFAIKKLPLQCKKIIEIIKRKNIEKRNKEKRKKQIAEKFGASNEDVDKLLLQIDKMNKINSELGNSETVWDELKFTLESNPRCISKVQRFFDLYVTDMLEIFEISKSSTTVSEEKLISVINLTSKCAKILIDDINQTNVNSVHSKLEMLENRLNNDLNSRI